MIRDNHIVSKHLYLSGPDHQQVVLIRARSSIAVARLDFIELKSMGLLALAARSHLLFGLLVASLSAFAAIFGLMRFLERFSTWPFVIYRAGLGVLLVVAVSNGWLS